MRRNAVTAPRPLLPSTACAAHLECRDTCSVSTDDARGFALPSLQRRLRDRRVRRHRATGACVNPVLSTYLKRRELGAQALTVARERFCAPRRLGACPPRVAQLSEDAGINSLQDRRRG